LTNLEKMTFKACLWLWLLHEQAEFATIWYKTH